MYLRRVYSLVPRKPVTSNTMRTNNIESRSGGMQIQICEKPALNAENVRKEFMSRQRGIATMRRTGMGPVQKQKEKGGRIDGSCFED